MANLPKIVVFDSNADALSYLSTLLMRMNFDVYPVRLPAELIPICSIVKPQVLICDVSDCSDQRHHYLEQLCSDIALQETRILLTGESEEGFKAVSAITPNAFLAKPFGISKLNKAIQNCFIGKTIRKDLRTNYSRDIILSFKGKEKKYFSVTLSEGGIYLRSNNPLPVDSQVTVKLTLTSGNEIELTGKVIYVMRLSTGAFLIPPGMAIQFNKGENPLLSLMLLSYEVERLLIGDLIEEQEQGTQVFTYSKDYDASIDTEEGS